MDAMAQDPAKWREWMNEKEREELASAERARNAVADNLRAITARLKERCMKRMKRAKPSDDA